MNTTEFCIIQGGYCLVTAVLALCVFEIKCTWSNVRSNMSLRKRVKWNLYEWMKVNILRNIKAFKKATPLVISHQCRFNVWRFYSPLYSRTRIPHTATRLLFTELQLHHIRKCNVLYPELSAWPVKESNCCKKILEGIGRCSTLWAEWQILLFWADLICKATALC